MGGVTGWSQHYAVIQHAASSASCTMCIIIYILLHAWHSAYYSCSKHVQAVYSYPPWLIVLKKWLSLINASQSCDTSSTISRMNWWKHHELELPFWSSACKSTLLLQPSSAAAERVFSLLNNSFKEQQG